MANVYKAPVSFIHHPKLASQKTRFSTFVSPKTRFSKLVSPKRGFLVLISHSNVKPTPSCSMQQLVQSKPTQNNNVDLKLTIQKSGFVTPIGKSERRTNFLSNMDHLFNFMTHTVQFFDMNPDFPFESVVTMYETAYKKVLMYYDFLAGRLKWNTQDCRLEIDCNSAGSGFVVAASELRLEELGDLVQPKQCYEHLTPRKLRGLHPEDQPLVIIQVTSFKCGGFAIGFSISHIALDGVSSTHFAKNIISMIVNNRMMLPPYNNSQLLAAKSPPCVNFLHPEFVSLKSMNRGNDNPIPMKATFQKLECKVLNLSANVITMLNELAKKDSEYNARSTNTFSLVAAHIWRCVALAKKSESEPKKTSTLLVAINVRSRVQPRLPASYSGNGVFLAHSTTTYSQLGEGPISHIANMVSQGVTKMNDEYVRSVIDYLGVNKMIPSGDLLLSSWLKHGMDVEYPWGKAKWSTPVLPNHGNNAIILLPNIEGTTDGGINVLVSLPHKEMEKFQDLFYKF